MFWRPGSARPARAPIVAAILLTAHAVGSAQSREVILAADLGTHLDPIARSDGSTWSPIPSAGLGRLAPREWTRWSAPGPSLPIRLGVAEPIGRCAVPRRLAIASPPARPPGTFDETYVGIAATGALSADGLRRVTEGSPEWAGMTAAIASQFEPRARASGVSPAALAKVAMSVDWVFATRGTGPAIYYFEASKRIPDAGDTPSEDPKGVVRIGLSGWLRALDGGFVPAGTKGELLWTPENDPSSHQPGLVPIGVLRQGDERVWVMKGRVGTRDTFTLYAQRASVVRTLFTVDAAMC